MKYIIDYFKSIQGREVEIKYTGLLYPVCVRKGKLVIDGNWMYLYSEGKTGNNYNAAFMLIDVELKRIIEVTELNDLQK